MTRRLDALYDVMSSRVVVLFKFLFFNLYIYLYTHHDEQRSLLFVTTDHKEKKRRERSDNDYAYTYVCVYNSYIQLIHTYKKLAMSSSTPTCPSPHLIDFSFRHNHNKDKTTERPQQQVENMCLPPKIDIIEWNPEKYRLI